MAVERGDGWNPSRAFELASDPRFGAEKASLESAWENLPEGRQRAELARALCRSHEANFVGARAEVLAMQLLAHHGLPVRLDVAIDGLTPDAQFDVDGVAVWFEVSSLVAPRVDDPEGAVIAAFDAIYARHGLVITRLWLRPRPKPSLHGLVAAVRETLDHLDTPFKLDGDGWTVRGHWVRDAFEHAQPVWLQGPAATPTSPVDHADALRARIDEKTSKYAGPLVVALGLDVPDLDVVSAATLLERMYWPPGLVGVLVFSLRVGESSAPRLVTGAHPLATPLMVRWASGEVPPQNFASLTNEVIADNGR